MVDTIYIFLSIIIIQKKKVFGKQAQLFYRLKIFLNTVSSTSKKENVLLFTIILGVAFGLGLGVLLKFYVDWDAYDVRDRQLYVIYLGFAGEIMMRAFKMIMIPILILSIVSGITNMGSENSGTIGKVAFIYYRKG